MNDKDIVRASMIDSYLAGSLTDEEMIYFNKQLQEDASLRAALENYEISRDAVRNYALRNDLRHIRHQMKQEEAAKPSGKQVSLWQYAAKVAAAVVLLIIAFFAIQMATLSGERLYNGKVFPVEVWTTRGAAGLQEDQAIKVLLASGNYQQVIDDYQAQFDPSVTATFIAGNAYLQQDMTDKAIAAFKKVEDMNTNTQDKRFVEEAHYYLALSYLRGGDYDQALRRFEAIKASDGNYSQYVGSYFLLKLRALDWLN